MVFEFEVRVSNIAQIILLQVKQPWLLYYKCKALKWKHYHTFWFLRSCSEFWNLNCSFLCIMVSKMLLFLWFDTPISKSKDWNLNYAKWKIRLNSSFLFKYKFVTYFWVLSLCNHIYSYSSLQVLETFLKYQCMVDLIDCYIIYSDHARYHCPLTSCFVSMCKVHCFSITYHLITNPIYIKFRWKFLTVWWFLIKSWLTSCSINCIKFTLTSISLIDFHISDCMRIVSISLWSIKYSWLSVFWTCS